MIMYPFLDAVQSSNLLLPKTKIEMDIELNDINFYFIGQTARARLDEGAFRMTFYLKEVKLDSAVVLNMRQTLQKRNTSHASSYQNRNTCLGYTLWRGITQYLCNLFRGKVPRGMVMGLLHKKSLKWRSTIRLLLLPKVWPGKRSTNLERRIPIPRN